MGELFGAAPIPLEDLHRLVWDDDLCKQVLAGMRPVGFVDPDTGKPVRLTLLPRMDPIPAEWLPDTPRRVP